MFPRTFRTWNRSFSRTSQLSERRSREMYERFCALIVYWQPYAQGQNNEGGATWAEQQLSITIREIMLHVNHLTTIPTNSMKHKSFLATMQTGHCWCRYHLSEQIPRRVSRCAVTGNELIVLGLLFLVWNAAVRKLSGARPIVQNYLFEYRGSNIHHTHTKRTRSLRQNYILRWSKTIYLTDHCLPVCFLAPYCYNCNRKRKRWIAFHSRTHIGYR